jgi:hypothetical protein
MVFANPKLVYDLTSLLSKDPGQGLYQDLPVDLDLVHQGLYQDLPTDLDLVPDQCQFHYHGAHL